MEFLGFTVDVATLTSNALEIVIKVALAILIFIVGRWLAKKAVDFFGRLMARSHLDETVSGFFKPSVVWRAIGCRSLSRT
ncbi:hypothetical protein PKHYL_30890 [Psychrobacter sp. KH172YL61]|uniref:mechanosensitive ion channel family protein n=1 Tax=Psychrobacter sp. KH172YL61 TaxID=2517899 RepID=UPI0010BAF5DD|nr:hypothetical protein [Psychrobacter sp. KH172YL61]BBI68898.1 hypothetical protein PKHYL_30890 [Psychrobacter sp. KH172YL61]